MSVHNFNYRLKLGVCEAGGVEPLIDVEPVSMGVGCRDVAERLNKFI